MTLFYVIEVIYKFLCSIYNLNKLWLFLNIFVLLFKGVQFLRLDQDLQIVGDVPDYNLT